jgi:hypothetical protein
VRVLVENLGWFPVRALLVKLGGRSDLAGEPRKNVDATLTKLKLAAAPNPSAQPQKPKTGPGFADE